MGEWADKKLQKIYINPKVFCNKINVEFYSKRIEVEKYANNNKIGLEEAGRILRYEFFEEVMNKEKFNKIAVAHNKNDKIETIIMNILRGTGISGLRGIEPIRNNIYIMYLITLFNILSPLLVFIF